MPPGVRHSVGTSEGCQWRDGCDEQALLSMVAERISDSGRPCSFRYILPDITNIAEKFMFEKGNCTGQMKVTSRRDGRLIFGRSVDRDHDVRGFNNRIGGQSLREFQLVNGFIGNR